MSHMSLMVVFSVLFLASFSCVDGWFLSPKPDPFVCVAYPPIPRCPYEGCAAVNIFRPHCRCYPIRSLQGGICSGCPFNRCNRR